MLALFECCYDAKSSAQLVTTVPGSHEIHKFGEAHEAERGAVNRTDRKGCLDFRATFFATYPAPTIAGFDRISRAHASATQK